MITPRRPTPVETTLNSFAIVSMSIMPLFIVVCLLACMSAEMNWAGMEWGEQIIYIFSLLHFPRSWDGPPIGKICSLRFLDSYM